MLAHILFWTKFLPLFTQIPTSICLKHSAHYYIILNSANWTRAGHFTLKQANQEEYGQLFCGVSSKIIQWDLHRNFNWWQRTNLQVKVHTWTRRPCELVRASSWALCKSKEQRTPAEKERLWNNWASLVAQLVKNLPAMQETWVWSLSWEDPLERIPWRERLPIPVFWPREFHELYSPWGCKESDTTERLSPSLYTQLLDWGAL